MSALFVLTPGADWAYAIAAGLRHRSVMPAVSGLLLGHLATTLAVACGIAAVLAGVPVLLSVLTLAGACYVIWLGVATLRAEPRIAAGPAPGSGSASRLRQLMRGAGVSGLNPKVFLLFLALLPQFTDPSSSWPVAAQIVLLGLIHTATCAVVYSGVGAGARTVVQARPAAARVVSRVSGGAMILVGVALLVDQLLTGHLV